MFGRWIEEIFFTNLHIIFFLSAVAFLFTLADNQAAALTTIEDTINNKYNVYEIKGFYEGSEDICTVADVVSHISKTPDSITVKIGSYVVTPEDKKSLRENNDASALLKKLNTNFSYRITYHLAADGQVQEVCYEQIY